MEKDKKGQHVPKEQEQVEVRGKKAIDAEKKAGGENPASDAVKKKEKKDAENWRNEG